MPDLLVQLPYLILCVQSPNSTRSKIIYLRAFLL